MGLDVAESRLAVGICDLPLPDGEFEGDIGARSGGSDILLLGPKHILKYR